MKGESEKRESTEGLESRSWKEEASLALLGGLWMFLESPLDSSRASWAHQLVSVRPSKLHAGLQSNRSRFHLNISTTRSSVDFIVVLIYRLKLRITHVS